MEKGTVSNHILKRSITRHVRKNDAALTGIGAATSSEDISMGNITEVAYLRAVNNLYGRGGSEIRELSLSFMLGTNVSEDTVRREMKCLTELAYSDNKNVIINGNTFVTGSLGEEEYTASIVIKSNVVEEYPESNLNLTISPGDRLNLTVSSGDRLILAGYPARYGTEMLIRSNREILKERFKDAFLEEYLWKCEKAGSSIYERYSIKKHIDVLSGCEIKCIKPVSFGGVYRAIWEMADEAGLGAEVDHGKLQMEQETVEVAEYFRINPYMMLGTGAFIIAADGMNSAKILEALCDASSIIRDSASIDDSVVICNNEIPVSDIGCFTKEKGCTVVSSLYDIKREITSYKTDEAFNLQSSEKRSLQG